jgi:type II secretory pathway pseudopilin PulG
MKSQNLNKGFTLIEMMVAMLVFILIIGAAISILVSAIRLQKYNLTYFKITDETSYVLEYISRQARMARRDSAGSCIAINSRFEIKQIPAPAPLGAIGLMFVDSNGACKGYFLNSSYSRIKEYNKPSGGSGSVLDLTPDDTEVSLLNFGISGQSGTDSLQPRVAISMIVKGKNQGVQPVANIQTTISVRNLDF